MLPGVPSAMRSLDRGTRRGHRHLAEIADELRERRLALGLSQELVASASRLSRSRYSRIEGAHIDTLTIVELAQIASVLGLDSAVRLFPGGAPIRDAGHVSRLRILLGSVRPPLSYRLEVPLSTERWDARAWDAVISGDGQRTAVELEMRLRDIQAMQRRISLKRRDDPVEHFLLVVADTKANRRLLDEIGAQSLGLHRIRRAGVLAELAAGRHPGTGLILV